MSEIKIQYMRLEDITRWPRNPKKHNIPELIGSLKRFGFVSPEIFDETTGRLVAGHGRLEALQTMQAEGAEPPERIKIKNGDWLVPVLRGLAFASETEAEAYLLADNKQAELGGWDDAMLAEILKDHVGSTLKGTGFSDDEFNALIKASEPKQPPENFKEFDDEIDTNHRCPKCGFEWSGPTK